MATNRQKSLSSWLQQNPSSPPQTFNKRKQTYEKQTHEERLIKQRIYDKERRPPRQSKETWKIGIYIAYMNFLFLILKNQRITPS